MRIKIYYLDKEEPDEVDLEQPMPEGVGLADCLTGREDKIVCIELRAGVLRLSKDMGILKVLFHQIEHLADG